MTSPVFCSLVKNKPFTQSNHSTKSHMLVTKLHSGTFKTKAGLDGLVEVALFLNSHCATYLPPCMHDFVYHM